jgi:pimeloyl-ACP methyl ester carboxylesterase
MNKGEQIMSEEVSGIFVDDDGVGSVPVIFIHALAGNTRQWSAQLDHIRKTRRAIALDLRGHGQSAAPANGDYAIEAMVQDIRTVVDQLGVERFVLVGHSMGGSVAGAYAGAHPEQVAGLLLADPSGDSTQMPVEEVRQYLDALASEAYTNVVEGYWRQLLSGGAETTEVKVMQDLRNTSKATVVGILRELYKYNPVPALKRFDGPRLSIISSHSENPLALQNLVSDLPYQKITGTGHWLQLDKPEEFNRMMDDFLASIGNGSLH